MVPFQLRAGLFAALACAAGCANTPSPAVEEVASFALATPRVADVTLEKEHVADLRAVRHAELRARLPGILDAVTTDEGAPVKTGQVLFRINARTLDQEIEVARADVLAAEAERSAAELEAQQTRSLRDQDIVSPAELAQAQAKVQSAQAAVMQARARVDRARAERELAAVQAPFDGVVNRLPRRMGSAVTEGELLTTVTDARDIHAYFRVSEREYLAYQSAATRPTAVGLHLADGSLYPSDGAIDAVDAVIDRETGTLAFRARFANPSGVLKHGASGKVVVRTERRKAVLVPQRSTVDVQGDLFVYVVDGTGIARSRKVVVGGSHEDAFIVDSGITAGERFVLDGVHKLKDGARIRISNPTAGAPAAAAERG